MGLNPSCNMVPEGWTRFPNMAGVRNCDPVLRAELEAAGIEVEEYAPFWDQRSEVPASVVGVIGTGPTQWLFTRAWYYWVAKGMGIPPDVAERLHEKFGQVVRVEGHCMCPSPKDWCKGFAVGLYHVDAAEGLKALADVIKELSR